jgi:predicted ATP-grasp superfamily ATP-dependent carboligase
MMRLDPRRVPAIILGGGITGLGAVRSLGRAGVPCYVGPGAGALVRSSRWAQPLETPEIDWEFPTAGDAVRVLDSLPFERVVPVPCSDAWAAIVANLDPARSARFPWVSSPPHVLASLADKRRFAELAAACSIPHPRTIAINTVADLHDLPPSAGSAFFLKACNSQAFNAQFGVKAFEVHSLEEARQRVREAEAAGLGVIWQEYVPGPPTNHFFVDGFADRSGRVRARLVRQRLRMNPPLFGNSTYMRTIAPSDAPEIVAVADRLVEAGGIRGVFSVEFKRDERDGIARVLEVNARPWWYVAFAAACGINVCDLAHREATGEPIADVTTYTVGATCLFPYHDFSVARRLFASGQLSASEWARSWLSARRPIHEWTDPMPGTVRVASLGAHYIGHRAQRLARSAVVWLLTSTVRP